MLKTICLPSPYFPRNTMSSCTDACVTHRMVKLRWILQGMMPRRLRWEGHRMSADKLLPLRLQLLPRPSALSLA